MILLDKKLTWNQRGKLWFRLIIRAIIAIAVGFILFNFGTQIIKLFMPFILALIIAMILDPFVHRLQSQMRTKRSIVTLIVIAMLSIMTGIIIYLLVRSLTLEVIQLLNNWDNIMINFSNTIDSIEAAIHGLASKLDTTIKLPDETLMNTVINKVLETGKELLSDVNGIAEFAKEQISWFTYMFVTVLVFIMASYFITADYQKLCKNFSDALGTDLSEILSQIKRIFMAAFGGYVRARLLVAIGVGAIEFVGFIIIGQPYALILALIMVVLDFIPIIGSGTVIVPWATICLFTGHIGYGLKLLAIYGVISVFRNMAEPKVVGTQTGLSPILSLITIYIGMQVAGIVGMILGPVLTMTIINTLKIGVFSNTIKDIKLAISDISAILSEG